MEAPGHVPSVPSPKSGTGLSLNLLTIVDYLAITFCALCTLCRQILVSLCQLISVCAAH